MRFSSFSHPPWKGWYIGGELNSVLKDHRTVRGKLVIAFPDTYTLGTSHHGLQVLYSIMNADPQWACQRVFTPWLDFKADGFPGCVLRKPSMPGYIVRGHNEKVAWMGRIFRPN